MPHTQGVALRALPWAITFHAFSVITVNASLDGRSLRSFSAARSRKTRYIIISRRLPQGILQADGNSASFSERASARASMIRSHHQPHAGCPRGDSGRLPILTRRLRLSRPMCGKAMPFRRRFLVTLGYALDLGAAAKPSRILMCAARPASTSVHT